MNNLNFVITFYFMVTPHDNLEVFYLTKNIKSTFLRTCHVCVFFTKDSFYVTDPSTICTTAVTKALRVLWCI